MDDFQKVIQALEFWQHGLSLRLIADALGWRNAEGKLNTARVHRALVELALSRRVEKVGGRWRLVSGHKQEKI